MTSQAQHTDPRWAAGLFEGEGWVYVRVTNPDDRKAPKFIISVGITNTDLLLLEPFAATWGGRIRPRKGTALSRKALWEWRLEARRAEAFLCAIIPHVVGSKRSRISAAIALSERMRPAWRARTIDGRIAVIPEGELTWRRIQAQKVRA